MAQQEEKIYTIANAHLDTVWNWDLEHTITTCLYNTLSRNFRLFEKYPDYRFNFEGAYRYELIEEYYPELFEQLKEYVKAGRWCPCGSSYENGDVNVPSPEALFRNILYGNGYFDEQFGLRSKDIFLPDCFGFGWALPSVAKHANLLGFTTQKLTWGSAYGTPFDIGRWYGVDGKFIFAAVNPGAYDKPFHKIRSSAFLQKKLKENRAFGLPMTCAFHGVGDQGGAPSEKSVRVLASEMEENTTSGTKVLSAAADQIYRDLAEGDYPDLPTWKTELVMKNHGAGGYTSRAIGKRWNRMGEELADRTERCAAAAVALGTAKWPKVQLDTCWKRLIAHQFHDDLPGTSVQRAYQRSWNDYFLSIRQLTEEYEAAAQSVSMLMDSSFAQGIPVMVHNSLEYSRRALVTVDVPLTGCKAVQVLDQSGCSLPCQINRIYAGKGKMNLSFTADLPAMGFAVFDVRALEAPTYSEALRVTENMLENQRYRVTLNENGDVSSILDKELGDRELLAAPVTYDLFDYKGSKDWPAWELNYAELNRNSQMHPRKISSRILEHGNARVAIQVVQEARGSTFTTQIALTDGGQSVEFRCEVLWHSLQTALKHRFSFHAANPEATFDLGLGAIRRGNMTEKLFEVPAQKWADLTDSGGEYGVAVLSSCKYGWDKRDNHTLRMTAIHTPQRNYRKDSMQSFLDLGLNRYEFAIHSHAGESLVTVNRQAREFCQPAAGFVIDKHSGSLGSVYSFGTLDCPAVALRAVKQAQQDADTFIVRMNETQGVPQEHVTLSLGSGILSAQEVYASEEGIAPAQVEQGKLIFTLAPYEVKSFALKLKQASAAVQPKQQPLPIPFNLRAATSNHSTGDGILGSKPYSLPKEIMPAKVFSKGVTFHMGSIKKGQKNALVGAGQVLCVPDGFNTLSILAGSLNGDRRYSFQIGKETVSVKLHEVDERLGVWDLYELGETAHIRSAPLAYTFTHTHAGGKDQVAHQIYFYHYELPLNGATEIRLPDDPHFCLLAAAAVQRPVQCHLATTLSDRAHRRPMQFQMSKQEKRRYHFWKTFAEWHK